MLLEAAGSRSALAGFHRGPDVLNLLKRMRTWYHVLASPEVQMFAPQMRRMHRLQISRSALILTAVSIAI